MFAWQAIGDISAEVFIMNEPSVWILHCMQVTRETTMSIQFKDKPRDDDDDFMKLFGNFQY